jgi:hypothetical protein
MGKKFRLTSGMILLALSFYGAPTLGQKTILKSSIDQSLSIKTVTVAPMADNVSDVYAKPLTSQLRNIVEMDRQWDLRTFPESSRNTPEKFEDQPELVKATLKKAGTDALIATRLTKGPSGISVKMNLFLAHDGLLFAQENLENYQGFEIADLRSQLEDMYRHLKSKMPYSGIVLSRRNQQVTLNMGSQHGVKEGSSLSVIQIIKLNRHPRFQFAVSAEKEIIGRLQINKVEESLSFGSITLEREENIIQPGMKVLPIDFVAYSPTIRAGDGKIVNDISSRPDAPLVLGERPSEWAPQDPPTIGKFGFMLGLGSYAVNNTLTETGAVGSVQTLTPSVHLDGELWLTTHWLVGLGLKQYILSAENNLAGSSPSRVNISSSQIALQFGYNFLLSQDFFGPKFQVLGGFTKFQAIADTTIPTAYTNVDFSGMALGVAGSIPVSEEFPLSIGAKVLFYLSPTLNESPVTTGSSSVARMSSFSVYGSYRWTERMSLRGELIYDLFGASFSGVGTRNDSGTSMSHTLTTFAGGLEYLF